MNSKPFVIVTAIVIPLILFFISPIYTSLFNTEKSLSYAITHIKDLTEDYKDGESWSKLTTSFDGVKLDSAYLSRILIANTGQVPISRNDFDSDVIINLGDNTGILGVRVDESTPLNLTVNYEFDKGLVSFQGLLLNPQDQFVLEILSTQRPKLESVNSRISGVAKPQKMDFSEEDGIYLKYVKHESIATSKEKRLWQVNPVLMGIFSWISIVIILANLHCQVSKNSSKAYYLLYVPYSLSVCVVVVMIESMLEMYGVESLYLKVAIQALVFIPLIFLGSFVSRKWLVVNSTEQS
ncbi:hypothetical protein KW465_21020 [Vibrio fluvialis]|nr:hypothetical protein [Vibrio fluvialis]